MQHRDIFRDGDGGAPPTGADEIRTGILALFLRMEKERTELPLLLERERLLTTGEIARQTELIEIGSAALVVMMLHVLGVASIWWFAVVLVFGAYRHWHWGKQTKTRLRRIRDIDAALAPPGPESGPLRRE